MKYSFPRFWQQLLLFKTGIGLMDCDLLSLKVKNTILHDYVLIVLSQLSYLFILNGPFWSFGVCLGLHLMNNALPFQVLLPFSC